MHRAGILASRASRFSTSASQCRLKTAVPPAIPENRPIQEPPRKVEKSAQHPLLDNFQRQHTYLRISLTERCNLRCTYCMPEEGVPLTPSQQLLSADEIVRLAMLFAEHGVDKIRLTGGEPTIRKDLVEIIGRLSHIPGIKQIGMTSNGIVLARKLDALVTAGLNKLNISLDTLVDHKYQIMTRRNGLKKVLNLIDKAEPMFDQLKINNVVIRGTNDDEVLDFVQMTENKNVDIRFIEYMPFGGNKFDVRKMVPYKELLKNIVDYFGNVVRHRDTPNDTSKAYGVYGFKGKFGFISSMSEHFCGTCNRVRITADGNLKVCLHGVSEVSLRDQMRKGATDEELMDVIGSAMRRKKKQHAGIDVLTTMKNRPMILIDPISLASTQSSHTTISCNPRMLSHLISKTNLSQRSSVRFFSYSASANSSHRLTHLNEEGKATMVDVSSKSPTYRIALARAVVQVTPEIMESLVHNRNVKGDALAVARIAGITAAKKTSDLVPLCHNIPLSNVRIEFKLNEELNQVEIFGRAKTKSETGVEMEALTAVSVSALVIYDMCKALTHEMALGPTTLLGKRGGKRDFGVVEFKDL